MAFWLVARVLLVVVAVVEVGRLGPVEIGVMASLGCLIAHRSCLHHRAGFYKALDSYLDFAS